MRLTLRRHVPTAMLGLDQDARLLTPEGWDGVRTGSAPAFELPESREQWVSLCAEKHLDARAQAVAELVDRLGTEAVVSYGVGTACLELRLKQLRPALQLRISDWAPETVRRLHGVFSEADLVARVDLLHDDLDVRPRDLVLLHRVDTDLSNEEWRAVFERLCDAGARHILFVPTEFMTLRNVAAELLRRVRRERTTFAGYLRSRAEFDALWAGGFRVREEREVESVSLLLLEAR